MWECVTIGVMTARFATPDEISKWNSFVLANADGGNVFASYEYSEIKKLTQYTPRYAFVDDTAVTILEKKVFPLGVFWYLPKGPGVSSAKDLLAVVAALRPLAQKAGAFMVRTESELDASAMPELEGEGLKKAKAIIPNASTITLDISPPLDELLLSLPQKGRHAIRRAERDGVTVQQVEANDENTEIMYRLLSETAEGQFGIRSYNYYKTYWQTFESAGLGQLFFAYYEGAVVAGAYAMAFGEKSTYKDGASVRQRAAYGASHLLQWHVIKWAKSRGARMHDFCGSPPKSDIDNPEHPHYGIGRFKLSLSKHVVDYVGCYDYVLSPLRHAIWTDIGERVHRHVYYRQTKDYYY